MGRPSVKAERAAIILDAFERCVARHGVDGATLERIAEEAGLARALIRHHIGNRDVLLNSLVSRFLEKSTTATTQMLQALPTNHRLATLLDWLFDPGYSDRHSTLVANALNIAASNRPALAQQMGRWTDSFVQTLQHEITRCHPQANPQIITIAATGITGMYFSSDTLPDYPGNSAFRQAAKAAAQALLQQVEDSTK